MKRRSRVSLKENVIEIRINSPVVLMAVPNVFALMADQIVMNQSVRF